MTPTVTAKGAADAPAPNPAPSKAVARPAKTLAPPKSSGSRWWPQIVSLARYLTETEVHTYAFSVAANVILSLFPFIVLTWTIERHLFHSPHMEAILADMLRYFLPAHQDFVVRNMALLAHVRGRVQIISIVTLLISSTGVFLPLEVALNRVWKVPQNRSYLRNQVLSLGLAFAVGVLALLSIAFTAAQTRLIETLFFGRENFVSTLLADSVQRHKSAEGRGSGCSCGRRKSSPDNTPATTHIDRAPRPHAESSFSSKPTERTSRPPPYRRVA